jgi:hypothetical protein
VGFKEIFEFVGKAIDGAGVAVIALGILYFTARALSQRMLAPPDRYRIYRQGIGRVTSRPGAARCRGHHQNRCRLADLPERGVLALIVAIRTFLSFTLEVELEGRWPWQRPTTTRAAAPSSD